MNVIIYSVLYIISIFVAGFIYDRAATKNRVSRHDRIPTPLFLVWPGVTLFFIIAALFVLPYAFYKHMFDEVIPKANAKLDVYLDRRKRKALAKRELKELRINQ